MEKILNLDAISYIYTFLDNREIIHTLTTCKYLYDYSTFYYTTIINQKTIVKYKHTTERRATGGRRKYVLG